MTTKAIFTGSFDPLTNGHLDLIKRASTICDELVVGIILNPSKKGLFSLEERKEMIEEVTAEYENVSVDHFSGLLADYVNKNKFNIVVRGLRANTDFEYELQMAHMNAKLFENDVETVFLMTCPEYSYISSSMMKEVCSLGGDISGLVPDSILKKMQEKLTV